MGEFLEHALQYAARGWCILPMTVNRKGGKVPALPKYKFFHSNRPDERTLRRWFEGDSVEGRSVLGLGVMCGKVSGGLYCRDFDNERAYPLWRKARPNIAPDMPTVKTSRGMHVYGESDEAIDSEAFDDGELRAEKSFVVLPPSRHPSGKRYEWVIPLQARIPKIEPHTAGLNICIEGIQALQRRQSVQKSTENTENTEAIGSVLSVLSVTNLNAFNSTIPNKPGQRHRQVFRLARLLKGLPETASLPLPDLKPIVRCWFELAKPYIMTQDFDTTWGDFAVGWPNVHHPLGGSPVDLIFERINTLPPPPQAAQYDTPGVRLLVGLCAELQRQSGDAPFFLDTGTAARLLATDRMGAWRWLRMLAADGVLTEVEKGRPGRATRWRMAGGGS